MSSARAIARRELGAAAVFTESEAVRLLTCRDDVARDWLRESGLVHSHPVIGRYVLWAEVLAELGLKGPTTPEPPRSPSKLPRAGLPR